MEHPVELLSNNVFTQITKTTHFYRKIMNYLRKAFNLYQLTHRVDASATDIKELDESNDDEDGTGAKNADSTRSAATKARAIDMLSKRV